MTETLNAGASAWSRKDSGGYLAFYGNHFKAPDGDRTKWVKMRQRRINAANNIRLELNRAGVELTDANSATAGFQQNYRSDAYRSKTARMLKLVRSEGEWKIVEEVQER